MSDNAVKLVVDCSQAGALDPETAETFAGALRESALAAIANDDLAKAAALMQDAKDALAAGVAPSYQTVELDTDELAAHQALQEEASAAARTGRLADIVARCDRYLAQTDWIMVPAAARPVDMSASLAKACDDNQKPWTTWRAAVKAIRDAAVAGTADPDQPGFPDQPAAPAVELT